MSEIFLRIFERGRPGATGWNDMEWPKILFIDHGSYMYDL